jgi:hypothetical protein
LILSQHEGGQCLDDTTHIAKDKALRLITNQSVPTPQAIGIWLRRLGEHYTSWGLCVFLISIFGLGICFFSDNHKRMCCGIYFSR